MYDGVTGAHRTEGIRESAAPSCAASVPFARMTTRPRLTVIGTGYLGATHAVCMAELGFEVLGLDVVPEKVEALPPGEVPFFEPGLPELLRKNLDVGRLRFTTSFEEVGGVRRRALRLRRARRRSKGEYAADMTYVDAAFATRWSRTLKAGSLLVGKSTVPAGTARAAGRAGRRRAAATSVELAWNPEFLREGFAVEDTLHPGPAGVRRAFGDRAEQAAAGGVRAGARDRRRRSW